MGKIILKIENNVLVGVKEISDPGYELKEGEQEANIISSEDQQEVTLELPKGITCIGNPNRGGAKGSFRNIDSDSDDGLLLDNQMDRITSIELPDSIISITGGFFDKFINLKHIQFPKKSKIEEICPRAFADCENLEEVIIPENADGKEVSVGVDAFVGCSNAKTIEIPDNSHITLFVEKPFKGCEKLSKLYLKGTASRLNTNRDQIAITGGNTSGSFVSEGYTVEWLLENLGQTVTEIAFPKGITEILFSEATNGDFLETIYLPEGLISIGDCAFNQCKSLKKIKFPKGLTTIGDFAFAECENLECVEMNEEVISIGKFAFAECSKLSSIHIGESVDYIGECAFEDCCNLARISTNPVNSKYCSKDGVLFDKGETELVAFPAGKDCTEYSVPLSVTTIGFHAFAYAKQLKHVYLPQDLSYIAEGAFQCCEGLKSIYIPDEVSSIKRMTFGSCENLESVHLPKALRCIEDYSFTFCKKLTSVRLPDGLKTIGQEAFLECENLTNIYLPESLTYICPGAFDSLEAQFDNWNKDDSRNELQKIQIICKNNQELHNLMLNATKRRIGENIEFIDLPENMRIGTDDIATIIVDIEREKQKEARTKMEQDLKEQKKALEGTEAPDVDNQDA